MGPWIRCPSPSPIVSYGGGNTHTKTWESEALQNPRISSYIKPRSLKLCKIWESPFKMQDFKCENLLKPDTNQLQQKMNYFKKSKMLETDRFSSVQYPISSPDRHRNMGEWGWEQSWEPAYIRSRYSWLILNISGILWDSFFSTQKHPGYIWKTQKIAIWYFSDIFSDKEYLNGYPYCFS